MLHVLLLCEPPAAPKKHNSISRAKPPISNARIPLLLSLLSGGGAEGNGRSGCDISFSGCISCSCPPPFAGRARTARLVSLGLGGGLATLVVLLLSPSQSGDHPCEHPHWDWARSLDPLLWALSQVSHCHPECFQLLIQGWIRAARFKDSKNCLVRAALGGQSTHLL